MNEFSTSRLVLLVEYAGLNSSEPPPPSSPPSFLAFYMELVSAAPCDPDGVAVICRIYFIICRLGKHGGAGGSEQMWLFTRPQ